VVIFRSQSSEHPNLANLGHANDKNMRDFLDLSSLVSAGTASLARHPAVLSWLYLTHNRRYRTTLYRSTEAHRWLQVRAIICVIVIGFKA
jgi:hypothetical protein